MIVPNPGHMRFRNWTVSQNQGLASTLGCLPAATPTGAVSPDSNPTQPSRYTAYEPAESDTSKVVAEPDQLAYATVGGSGSWSSDESITKARQPSALVGHRGTVITTPVQFGPRPEICLTVSTVPMATTTTSAPTMGAKRRRRQRRCRPPSPDAGIMCGEVYSARGGMDRPVAGVPSPEAD